MMQEKGKDNGIISGKVVPAWRQKLTAPFRLVGRLFGKMSKKAKLITLAVLILLGGGGYLAWTQLGNNSDDTDKVIPQTPPDPSGTIESFPIPPEGSEGTEPNPVTTG